MAAEFVSGVVESVSLERVEALTAVRYGNVETPIKAKITLLLEDGTRAYVSKTVGQHSEADRTSGDFVGLKEYDNRQNVSEWPLVVEYDSQVVKSLSPEVFPNAFCLTLSIVPTIWIGDRVSVRGSVERKESKRGNAYLSVSRARVVYVERDGKEWFSGR